MNYRYTIDDKAWHQHLHEYGFVVIADVLNSDEVETAKLQLWNDIERVWPGSRNDYRKMKLPIHGLAPELCQSAGAWHVRGNRNVKQAFEEIWNETKLITSMDCVIFWRPWGKELNQKKPRTEGLHLDQNPFHKPNMEVVQGMVPLKAVNSLVGGLAVVPESHRDEAKAIIKEKYPEWKHCGDWCPIPKSDVELYDKQILLHAEPGDLILWDSRTVHGGVVGTGPNEAVSSKDGKAEKVNVKEKENGGMEVTVVEGKETSMVEEKNKNVDNDASLAPSSSSSSWSNDLCRMSVTVSMTPHHRASLECLQIRKDGFEKGLCFNHTPHEAGTSTGTIKLLNIDQTYVPPSLTKEQWQLLNGTIDGATPF
jgi:ectoine hydroxylase-related dioxygenase (phytanoyl-CoA dioxygenase family)